MYRLLLVDDEVEIIETYHSYLSRKLENFTIDSAHGGEEAFKKHQENPYDIIISDVRMPEGDGYFLIKKLNSLNPDQIPILFFCSGYSDIPLELLMEQGAQRFLEKPVSLKELSSLIVGALSEKKAS